MNSEQRTNIDDQMSNVCKGIVVNTTYQHLIMLQATLDVLILATPTGDRRNLLTEVNLHIMAALAAWQRLRMGELH